MVAWARIALLGALLTSASSVAAELPFSARWGEGLSWQDQPVRAPVKPELVTGVAPWVPASVPEVQGEITVGPDQAAAFWLSPLEVVQVAGEPGALRFDRVVGERDLSASWLRVRESGTAVRPGLWYLSEPIGEGSVWVVTADRRTTVRVQRPSRTQDALAEEALRQTLLHWVDGRADRPALPALGELRDRADLEAALAEVLLRGVPAEDPLHAAVRDWRKASLLAHLLPVQQVDRQTARIRWPTPPGERVTFDGFSAPFVRVDPAGGEFQLELEGPGVLALEVRPLMSEGTGAPSHAQVERSGRTEASLTALPRPAFSGPSPAMPGERAVRALPSGETVGQVEEVRLSLAPGKHTYTLRWGGGPSLLRVMHARRRPWSGEAIQGVGEWDAWAKRAWQALGDDRRIQAEILRAQLLALHPALGPAIAAAKGAAAPQGIATASPELRAMWHLQQAEGATHARRRGDLARQARTALAETGKSRTFSPLAWHLRLRTARVLRDGGEGESARALLRSAPDFPPTATLAVEAAELIASLPQGDPLRSREIAALELAWRKDPLSGHVRQRYREAWYRMSRWSALSPDESDDRPQTEAARWLDRNPATDEVVGVGALWPVSAGGSLRVRAAELGGEYQVLRAFISTSGTKPEPTVLQVGSARIPLLPLSAVEPVEVALPPGEHVVALQGAPGTTAWLTLGPSSPTPVGASREHAYVRTQWPLRWHGKPVRFRIPDSQLPSPVRVQLRAAGTSAEPVGVWLRTDLGPPMRLMLHPGKPSQRHLAIDGRAGPGSAAASAVVWLPPFTQEIWFDTDDAKVDVYAAVSVRRGQTRREELLRPAASGTTGVPSVPQLLALSRQIAGGDQTAGTRLRRAELLLDAAEEGLAREDLLRVFAQADTLNREEADRLSHLLSRLDGAFSSHARLMTATAEPVVLFPAYGALEGADSKALHELLRTAHTQGIQAALEAAKKLTSPAGRYAYARLLAVTGSHDASALALIRLYRDAPSPQLGLDAVRALTQVQRTPSAWKAWGAPMGAALSQQLSTFADLPLLRQMHRESARFARWQGVRDAETQVGTIHLLDRAPDDELDVQVRKALLAPPWPLEELRMVPPGRTSVVDLTTKHEQQLKVEALCGSVRELRHLPGKPCRFSLRVDGRTVGSERAALGEVAALEVKLAPGPHQVEVELEDTEEPVQGALRFVSKSAGSASHVEAPLPLPSLRTRPGEPVVLTALGPTAVRISARALGPDTGRALTVRDGDRAPVVLTLPHEADDTVVGAPSSVGREVETVLLLPESGPHRLTFDAAGGEALVRVRLGRTRTPNETDTEGWSRTATTLEPLPWPAMPPGLALLPAAPGGPREGSLGTLTAQLGILGEDVDDGDLVSPPDGALDARVAWRQEWQRGRVWTLIEPRARVPLTLSPVFGGRGAVHLRTLPWGLRLTGHAGALTQNVAGLQRSRVFGRVSVDRWYAVGDDFGLIPGLGVSAEHQAGGTPADGALFDRSVVWAYGAQHPLRISPRLTLRWSPFLDHLGEVSAFASSNSDVVTLDHATARIGWTTLLRSLPGARFGVGYEASWRLQDLHRSQSYLRHGLTAGADYSVWNGREGRLMVFAQDRAFLSGPFGLQNLFSVGVRYDWTFGRGLRDVMPFEEEFEELLDGTQQGR